MNNSKPQTLTANFYFPGTNVIGEVICKENPMTPARMRKIQIFRENGYKVFIWQEEDIMNPEGFDRIMRELFKELGRDYDQEKEANELTNI